MDDYQDLLRLSVATAGNDHRLGANEAPPAVISVFLGDELTAVLDAIENDRPYSGAEKTQMKLGVHVLPRFTRDTTDRNRTSPFAFTGNKFEFRMVGSSNSIACANIMLNSAVAESLKQFADRLEGSADFDASLHALIQETVRDHKRIIFNGNGYDDAWIREATEVRGLLNLRTTPDSIPHLLDAKNVAMLTAHKVYTEDELKSRCEIMMENYCKTVRIEARTMVDMAKREILPAVGRYAASVASAASAKKAFDETLDCTGEKSLLRRLSARTAQIAERAESLSQVEQSLSASADVNAEAFAIRDELLPAMDVLRAAADEAETLTAADVWPFPTYGDLLFGVR